MRTVLAVIVGAAVASAVFFACGMVANLLAPTPPELMNPQTPEATEARVAASSTRGLLAVIAGMALGALVGAVVGAKIAGRHTSRISASVGALLAVWSFYSFYVFYPSRLWFPAGLLIAALVFTYFGGVAYERWRRRRTER